MCEGIKNIYSAKKAGQKRADAILILNKFTKRELYSRAEGSATNLLWNLKI